MVYQSQFIARFGTTERSTYPVRTLREIAVSSGEYGANTPATKFNPAIGRYIRITDIDDSGNLNSDKVSPEVAEDKYLLHEGDLLFARTGATVGKTYLHKKGKAFYAGYLIKYRFLDAVLPDFVFAYTHSQEYFKWVELTQKVGAQPNISAKQYDGLRIIVPPLEEQKLFIVLMNQADKSKFDGFKSQFIGQFGSVVADKKLSDIAEIYDGVHQTPHYTDSGVRFISVEDITDIYASKKFISIEDYSKYKHVPDSGDLIMTRIGTIGMCAVVSKSEPLAYYVSVTLIKPDHSVIDSTYLKYYIESGYGQSELRMRSLLEAFPMKINLNEIGKIAIIVPALDRQRAFVSIVKQADKSKYLN